MTTKLEPLSLNMYQERALATAEPRAFHQEYLIPGIVGEVGELFGQKAKAYWHQWTPERLQDELINEYGDIAWMTALLLRVQGVSTLTPTYPDPSNGRWGAMDPMHALLHSADALHLQYMLRLEGPASVVTEGWIAEAAERLWRLLRGRAEVITGVPFEAILHRNLAKLADRAARGVLQGSGDHR